MTSTKWLAILSSWLLLLPVTANACYWYPEAETYRYSAFNPLSIPTSPYRSFFFSTSFLNDYSNHTGKENDRNRNIKEWAAYLHGQVSEKDIYDIMYNTSSATFFATVDKHKTYPKDSIIGNKFYKYISKPQNKNLFDYICFAKKCEAITANWNDPWEEMDNPTDTISTILLKSAQVVDLKVDSFLHLRYAFQYVRLCYYISDYASAIEVYEQEFEHNTTTSILKPWAMHYYANCLTQMGHNDKATYYYAKVFRQSDEKKNAAYNYFETNRIPAALAMAKNNDERADILSLTALERPGRKLNDLKKIYQLSQNHPSIELLVTREINKCEDWLMTNSVNNFNPVSRKGNNDNATWLENKAFYANAMNSDQQYAGQLLSFIEVLSKSKTTENKTFMYLAAAHLCFITGKDSTAIQHLTEAEKYQAKASEGIQLQLRLTRLMVQARMARKVDEAFEKKIYASIQWIQQHQKLPDAPRVLQQFMAFMASNYKHQGDVLKATLCRAHSNAFYQVPNVRFVYDYDEDNIEAGPTGFSLATVYLDEMGNGKTGADLLKLLDKKDKTAFEKLLCGPLTAKTEYHNELIDLVGTLYLREDSLSKAFSYFNRLPTTYWHEPYRYRNNRYEYLDANPFYAHIGNNHRCNDADSITYDKATFTKKLLALKSNRHADANTLLTIAHAYYNMTDNGNSWQLVRNFQSNNTYFNHQQYNEQFYGCERAKAYYQKALETASDIETKAVCCLMMAQCEKNHKDWQASKDGYRWEFNLGFDRAFYGKYTSNAYLIKFVKEYANTKYCIDIIEQCGGREAFGNNLAQSLYFSM